MSWYCLILLMIWVMTARRDYPALVKLNNFHGWIITSNKYSLMFFYELEWHEFSFFILKCGIYAIFHHMIDFSRLWFESISTCRKIRCWNCCTFCWRKLRMSTVKKYFKKLILNQKEYFENLKLNHLTYILSLSLFNLALSMFHASHWAGKDIFGLFLVSCSKVVPHCFKKATWLFWSCFT